MSWPKLIPSIILLECVGKDGSVTFSKLSWMFARFQTFSTPNLFYESSLLGQWMDWEKGEREVSWNFPTEPPWEDTTLSRRCTSAAAATPWRSSPRAGHTLVLAHSETCAGHKNPSRHLVNSTSYPLWTLHHLDRRVVKTFFSLPLEQNSCLCGG